MSTFYYNRFSNESRESQWSRHIQNQSYIEDVNKYFRDNTKQQTKDFSGIISQQTREFNENIREASREQVLAIQESTNAVCGTLNAGFELLSDNLQDISYSIDELRSEVSAMSSMLNWKLSLLIEHQRITNLLLGNIAILLRIPDIQKERQYHIEQGIKFLKNAIFDSDFYEDSLNNLLKAEKIEPADFFALHRIGLIYLYSPKHLELNKAEEYFKKAAKYAVAETNVGASITTNYLAGDLNKNLTEQGPSIDSIKLQAAEAFMFAGRSYYIQGKLNEAAEYASKAFNLVPQLVEAGFTQAKALAANNNDSQAAIVLEKVINRDRFYSLKTLSDLDLCPRPSILSLLKKLQKEATDKAIDTLHYCKGKIILGSNATEYLNKIERLTNKNTYLTSKKAIDLFEKVKDWQFCEPFKNPNQVNYLNELISMVNSFVNIKYYLVNTISNFHKDLNKQFPVAKGVSKQIEVGGVYDGVITKIMDFGAFVEFFPDKEGLLHISQIDNKRVNKITDYFKEGDKVTVKLIKIENGKFALSRKDLLPEPEIESKLVGNNYIPIDAYFIDTVIKIINIDTQWTFPSFSSIINNSNWTNEIRSQLRNLNLIQFIIMEKKINDDLPMVISSIKNLLTKASRENTEHLNFLVNKRQKADNANLAASVGVGILGGLGGVVGGIIVGFCVGLIVQIASCISNDWTEKGSGKYSGVIVLSSMVIGGIIGYIINFKNKRKNFSDEEIQKSIDEQKNKFEKERPKARIENGIIICPKCNTLNPLNFDKCRFCGTLLIT